MIANGLSKLLASSDEVIVTGMEHHANIVTWQQACKAAGATLRTVSVTDKGELDLDEYLSLLNENTKLVAFPHVSNSLGTVNPIKWLTEQAKKVGAWVFVDGAQGIAPFVEK